MSNKPISNPRHERGVVAVEMALIVVPMVLLCFGISEMGRALYQYNGLVKATRGAARYLSQQNLASPPDGFDADQIRRRAKLLALCGKFDCGTEGDTKNPPVPSLVPGLDEAMISVCDAVSCPTTHANVSTGQGTTSLVSVVIGAGDNVFQFSSLAPFVIPNLNFAPVRITMAASTN